MLSPSYQEINGNLTSALLSNAELFIPGMLIVRPNAPKEVDSQVEALDPKTDAWIKFEIQFNFSQLSGVGTYDQRTTGTMVHRIMTPLGFGDGRGKAIAASVVDLWRSTEVNPIVLREARLITGAELVTPVKWWEEILLIPFTVTQFQ